MRCTLEANSARTFAKAVQSLSKVGTELFIEADQNGLQMRAINMSHSAVGNMRFKRVFFQTYQLQPNVQSYCRVTMKSCLSVFRNMRQIEHCELRILETESKFQIHLKYKLDTVKSARLAIVDDENINAAASAEDTANVIVGFHKLFSEIISNFNTVEEELTLEAQPTSLTAKNYVEGSRVHDKFMRSQLKVCSTEFDTYNVKEDASVTFCLREFRAFMLFAEALNESVTLKFNDAGSPMFMEIKKLDLIECLLIMSTLSPEDVSFSEDCRERELSNASILMAGASIGNNNGVGHAQKRKNNNETDKRLARDVRRRIAEATTLSNSDDSSLFQFNAGVEGGGRNQTPDSHTNSVQAARLLATSREEAPQTVAMLETESGPQITFYNTEDVEDVENIPQSPERMVSIRRIFSRCFESTFVPREPSPSSEMFAANSDTED